MVMTPSASETRLIAMLIDGDNAQPSLLEHILAETAKYGVVTTRRIYGDWTQQQMGGWKEALHVHAIQPVQQFRYTVGKNATDSALIIDAMDLLHTRALGGFCLVSSDSDFTRLATRIREDGLPVYGFGEQKTPKAFIQACDRFIYTEIFRTKAASPSAKTPPTKPEPLRNLNNDQAFRAALDQSIEKATSEEGRAHLGAVGTQLLKLLPDFDPRNYGFQKLSELVASIPNLKLDRHKNSAGNQTLYVTRK